VRYAPFDRSRLPRVRVSFLFALMFAGACSNDAQVTATRPVERTPLRSQGPVTAEIFAEGVISDAQEQWRITFTPDGHTAYFVSSSGFFPITRQATIYESHLVDGTWTTPTVAPFSGTYSDIDPFLSPNGQRLYFSSIRPMNGVLRGDIDIWYVDRTPDGWGDPVRLGAEINSADDELYPSADANGTLYFASGPLFPQPGKHFDIYSAERAGDGFAPRQALGPAINTTPTPNDAGLQDAWEFNPEISVDGKTLLFTSLRPGGYGLGDIYVSHFVKGEWTPTQNLGPLVNTAADEFHPTLTRNKQELYFVRRIPRRGNFYHISTSVLDRF
jgi:Tol biopolymer transport system component